MVKRHGQGERESKMDIRIGSTPPDKRVTVHAEPGRSSGGIPFDDVLGEACRRGEANRTEAYAAGPLNETARGAASSWSASRKEDTIAHAEKVLTLLDDYRRTLCAPGATAEGMGPLVERLESEKSDLIPLIETLEKGDSLRTILNNVLVTSTIEVTRFKRGDYFA